MTAQRIAGKPSVWRSRCRESIKKKHGLRGQTIFLDVDDMVSGHQIVNIVVRDISRRTTFAMKVRIDKVDVDIPVPEFLREPGDVIGVVRVTKTPSVAIFGEAVTNDVSVMRARKPRHKRKKP